MSVRQLLRKVGRLEALAELQAQSPDALAELQADPTTLMTCAGWPPDPWQRQVLCSANQRQLLLASRQSGKSSVAAAVSLHTALTRPRSPVLLLSPSTRQSGELFRKVMALFNALDRPLPVVAESALRVDFAYTPRDQVGTMTYYTDLAGTQVASVTTYAYDAAMRLTGITQSLAGGSVLASYAYGYDQASRLTSEVDNGGATIVYAYDAADQLTQAGALTYDYDPAGNRTNTGYTTGSANELTGDGTYTYTYDAEGNEVSKRDGSDLTTYSYDNADRLTGVIETVGGTLVAQATYVYDVYGDRLSSSDYTQSGGTQTTSYAYDGTNAWADLNSSGQLQTRRLYGASGQLLARVSGTGTAAWYLTDDEGSVRDIVNYAGTMVLDQISYDAFGNKTSESSPADGDRYGYTSEQFDAAVGLQYNQARYYDPATGRWISQDPLGFGAGDPNLYRYAGNNPTNGTDPSGLAVTSEFGGGGLANGADESQIQTPAPPVSPIVDSLRVNDPAAYARLIGQHGGPEVQPASPPSRRTSFLEEPFGPSTIRVVDWSNLRRPVWRDVPARNIFGRRVYPTGVPFLDDLQFADVSFATSVSHGELRDALRAVQGFTEILEGLPWLVTPLTALPGLALVGHGADTLKAAFLSGATGEDVHTLTQSGTTAAARWAGFSEGNADLLGILADTGVPLAAGIGGRSLLRAAQADARLVATEAAGVAPNGLPRGADLSFVNRAQGNTAIDQAIRFTDAEILSEMNRSAIGNEVVNAANANTISLEFQPYHPQAGVRGYCIPNTNRGIVFVENNTEFAAPGVIDRAATLREVGSTGVHEGLHSMGLGGSWEAELWVRRLTFEHSFGRAATAAEVAQMEAEMQAAGRVYASLPKPLVRPSRLVAEPSRFRRGDHAVYS